MKFDEYKDLTDNVKEKIDEIVRKDDVFEGKLFFQDWDEEDGATESYAGRTLGQKKRANGLICFDVKYWLPGCEDNFLIDSAQC